jgi:hypothetical protein
MRHPLLLQRSLPPLPKPPASTPPEDFEKSYLDLLGPPGSNVPKQSRRSGGSAQERWQEQTQPPPPRAVDFTVEPAVRVITVTGPNTGGKTASLKALGLAALMPKAGLFLPLESQTGQCIMRSAELHGPLTTPQKLKRRRALHVGEEPKG